MAGHVTSIWLLIGLGWVGTGGGHHQRVHGRQEDPVRANQAGQAALYQCQEGQMKERDSVSFHNLDSFIGFYVLRG